MILEKNSCVYLHINIEDKEIFYVGIGNLQRPFLTSGRNKFWKKYVESINQNYIVIIIHTDLSWEEASIVEKQLIIQIGRKDKNLGTLTNRTNGGEGNQSINYWLKEELIKEALKYNTRKDFFYNSTSAYKASDRRGILNEICSHMFSYKGKNDFKLTKENCYKIATNFETKGDLFKHKKSIYNKIIKNKWDSYCFAHMKKKVDKNYCTTVALSFKTTTELMNENKYIYNFIIKNKWQKELFSHMVKHSSKILKKYTNSEEQNEELKNLEKINKIKTKMNWILQENY